MTDTPSLPDTIETERLRLRRWRDVDREPFAALNADAVTMEFLPAPLTRGESDAFIDRIERTFAEAGLGLWAVETTLEGSFLGYVGLWPATFAAHFTPAVEVGWRLSSEQWGRGFATEAARAAVGDGFDRLGLDEIVSFTAADNRRSRRVMEKLGMTTDPDEDFDHPSLAVGHRLRRHALYRLRPGVVRTGPAAAPR
jgi:RimJ/RimL family protein N-acetyltransferase